MIPGAAQSVGSKRKLSRVRGLLLTRHRWYFFLVVISWGCFAFNIIQMGHVLIEWPAPLGLISYLKWTYWVAVSLLIATSVAAFLDRAEQCQTLFVALALSLGICIVSLGVFVEANARNPASYGNFSLVRNLLSVGHIEFGEPSTVGSYRSWPGAHYVLTTVLLSTGLKEPAHIFKYLSLAWPFYLTGVTQAIGSRFGLSPKQKFALTLLPIASSLGWDDYPATFIGHVLYFLCVMIALSPRRIGVDLLLLFLLAAGTVMSHPIIGAALFLSFVGLVIFRGARRHVGAMAIFIMAIMGIWYWSFASRFIVGFIGDVSKYWVAIFRAYFQPSTYKTLGPPPLGRLTVRYSQLFFYVAYLFLGLRHVVWMGFRMREGSAPPMARALFGSLVMLIPLAVVLPLGEGIPRVIVIGSVWTVLLLILTNSRSIVVLACMVLFTFVLPFTRYAGEGMWEYVASSTLAGAKFFASKVDVPRLPNHFFAYHGISSLIIYFNPQYNFAAPIEPVSFMDPSALSFDVSRLSEPGMLYVILDKQGHDAMLWSFGYDPFGKWPEIKDGMVNKLYDNKNFQIYQNIR